MKGRRCRAGQDREAWKEVIGKCVDGDGRCGSWKRAAGMTYSVLDESVRRSLISPHTRTKYTPSPSHTLCHIKCSAWHLSGTYCLTLILSTQSPGTDYERRSARLSVTSLQPEPLRAAWNPPIRHLSLNHLCKTPQQTQHGWNFLSPTVISDES